MRRRRLPLALLAVLLAAAADATAAAADACAALPFRTLSHSCSGVCAANATCVVYDAAQPTPCALVGASPKSSCITLPATATSAAGCVYQCFAPDKDTALLRFYVLFNATRQTRAPDSANSNVVDTAGDTPPFESNEYVRRVGVLELPPNVTKVVISGGRNEDSAPRGDVVDLDIDAAVFSKTPKLKLLGFLNVDIGGRVPDFPSIFPDDVGALDLTNSNLKEIPASLNKFKTLDSLSLQRNFLADVPATVTLPLLKRLYAGENDIKNFAAAFPIIEILDLADNKLLEFPKVVFDMSKLNTLKLNQNPDMATVVFSTAQYERLNKLEEFSIDNDAMDNSSCKSDQIKRFRGLSGSVCVVSDAELEAYVPKIRGEGVAVPTSGPTTTPGRSGGSNQEATPSDRGMSGAVLAVIIVGVGLVCVGAGVAAFFYFRKRKQKQLEPPMEDDTNRRFRLARMNDPSSGTSGVSRSNGSAPSKKARHALLLSDGSVLSSGQSLWDDDEMLSRQLQLEDIEDLRVIGSGGFAIVWLVRYLPQNRLLASKRLIKDQVTRQKTMDFVMEIKLNMQLEHPNIVQLIGVAWTIETDLQALLEYMPHGDLRAHLETTTITPWDARKLQLAIDIIEALVYVHSFSPPLVHRDLKSRNVLLADDMKAKLCDFGVSRFASVNNTMTTAVGTGKWLAPEVVAGSKSYDQSCDIYSFGVVMTELDTHRLPYDDVVGTQGARLPEVAVLQMVSSGQLQPTLSASCPDEIRDIALKCLAFTPADRPSAMEAAYALRQARRAFSALV